jgi:3-methyladenine DNA glycosylase AlkD
VGEYMQNKICMKLCLFYSGYRTLLSDNSHDMNEIIESIRIDLIRNADEKTKQSGERFFKENVKIYGVKSAVVNRIGEDHYKKLGDKSKTTVFSICEELWKSGIMEESFIACNWSYNVHRY